MDSSVGLIPVVMCCKLSEAAENASGQNSCSVDCITLEDVFLLVNANSVFDSQLLHYWSGQSQLSVISMMVYLVTTFGLVMVGVDDSSGLEVQVGWFGLRVDSCMVLTELIR